MFPIDKGVRHGCPLSALLFVLCIEVLAMKVRQDRNIEGFKLPLINYQKSEAKISLYADGYKNVLEK